jgi:signal transduction histidine kinase
VEFCQDLSTSAGRMTVDPNALRTALVNILENAFDACRLDRKKTGHQVNFSLASDGDTVVFEVNDNGVGMDRETVDRAFTLFFSSKGNEGTGLGLFISNKIVRQLGGTITLDSTLDVGTRFRVRVPRNPADCSDSRAPYSASARSEPA